MLTTAGGQPPAGDAYVAPAGFNPILTTIYINEVDDNGNNNKDFFDQFIANGGAGSVQIESNLSTSPTNINRYNITEVTYNATDNKFTISIVFISQVSGSIALQTGPAIFYFATSTYGSGSGDVSVSGVPVNNQITVWTDASTVEGDADLTWSGTALTVTGRATITDRASIALINVDNSDSGGALTSNGDYGYGSRIYIGSGISDVVAGRTYNLSSTTWAAAVSNSTEAAASGLIMIATGNNSANGLVLNGIVYTGTTGTGGDKVYLSSNGVPTTTIPTATGDFVRIIGHVISTGIIYFNPSNDYIELS